jgi:hypothetical protein
MTNGIGIEAYSRISTLTRLKEQALTFMEIITKSISNKDNSQQVAVAVVIVLTQNAGLSAQTLNRI